MTFLCMVTANGSFKERMSKRNKGRQDNDCPRTEDAGPTRPTKRDENYGHLHTV